MITSVIPRYFVVAESGHELQNPISEEKLVLLGRRLGLSPDSRVLDIASGRGGPRSCSPASSAAAIARDRDLARLPRRGGRAHRAGGTCRSRHVRVRERRGCPTRAGVLRRRALPRRQLRLRQSRRHGRRARARRAPGRPRRRRRAVLASPAAAGGLRGPQRPVDDARRHGDDLRDVGAPGRRPRSRPRRTTGIATRRSTGRPSSAGSRTNAGRPGRAARSARDTRTRSASTSATARDVLGWAVFVGWKRP